MSNVNCFDKNICEKLLQFHRKAHEISLLNTCIIACNFLTIKQSLLQVSILQNLNQRPTLKNIDY